MHSKPRKWCKIHNKLKSKTKRKEGEFFFVNYLMIDSSVLNVVNDAGETDQKWKKRHILNERKNSTEYEKSRFAKIVDKTRFLPRPLRRLQYTRYESCRWYCGQNYLLSKKRRRAVGREVDWKRVFGKNKLVICSGRL